MTPGAMEPWCGAGSLFSSNPAPTYSTNIHHDNTNVHGERTHSLVKTTPSEDIRAAFKAAVYNQAAVFRNASVDSPKIQPTAAPEPSALESDTQAIDKVSDLLPASALPFTLRSSSLAMSTPKPTANPTARGPVGGSIFESKYADPSTATKKSLTNQTKVANGDAPDTLAHRGKQQSISGRLTAMLQRQNIRNNPPVAPAQKLTGVIDGGKELMATQLMLPQTEKGHLGPASTLLGVKLAPPSGLHTQDPESKPSVTAVSISEPEKPPVQVVADDAWQCIVMEEAKERTLGGEGEPAVMEHGVTHSHASVMKSENEYPKGFSSIETHEQTPLVLAEHKLLSQPAHFQEQTQSANIQQQLAEGHVAEARKQQEMQKAERQVSTVKIDRELEKLQAKAQKFGEQRQDILEKLQSVELMTPDHESQLQKIDEAENITKKLIENGEYFKLDLDRIDADQDSQLMELGQALVDAQNSLERSRQELDRHNDCQRSLEQQLESLSEKLTGLQNDRAKTEEQLQATSRQQEDIHREIKRVNDEAEASRRELESQMDENSAALMKRQNELNALKHQNEEAQEAKAAQKLELSKQLTTLSDEIYQVHLRCIDQVASRPAAREDPKARLVFEEFIRLYAGRSSDPEFARVEALLKDYRDDVNRTVGDDHVSIQGDLNGVDFANSAAEGKRSLSPQAELQRQRESSKSFTSEQQFNHTEDNKSAQVAASVENIVNPAHSMATASLNRAQTKAMETAKTESNVGNPMLNAKDSKPTATKPSADVAPVVRHLKAEEPDPDSLWLKAWPEPTRRPVAQPKLRRVKLTNIAPTASFAEIQAVVWGGAVEAIVHPPGATFAWVVFQKSNDCDVYVDSTKRGVKVPGQDTVISVERSNTAEPTHAALQDYYDNHAATRCVRIMGLPADWTKEKMNQIGSEGARKLEQVFAGTTATGQRVAEFRFSNVYDAIKFHNKIKKDEVFNKLDSGFCADPCARRTEAVTPHSYW